MMDDKTRGNSIHSGLTIEFFLNFYKIHIERLLSLKYHYLPFCHFLSVSKTFLFYARIYFLGRFFKNGNFFGKLAYFYLFLVIFRVKLSKNKTDAADLFIDRCSAKSFGFHINSLLFVYGGLSRRLLRRAEPLSEFQSAP